jgi:chloramphenicol 3-O phosphotransferase
VVLLTGTSLSGKTSLAQAVQEMAAIPFLHVEADRALPHLPNGHPLWNADSENRRRAVVAFHRSIRVWASEGFNVIVDGSLPYEDVELRDRCLALFEEFRICVVGVVCRVDALPQRERARNHPFPGWAAHQARDVNSGLNLDAQVDTSAGDPSTCARSLLEQLGLSAK